MPYAALATDYDGTIARDGTVSPEVIDALSRVRESGRALILVTGRRMPDLLEVFPRADLFDRIVAENGGTLYVPSRREERVLAQAPPPDFVNLLRDRGAEPAVWGKVIVATVRPHEIVALDAIRALGLELQVIFNKDAVMILPSGVNKATGLRTALEELRLAPEDVVGIGDAENDHAFLELCGFSAAVRDAVPALRERATWVASGGAGEAVLELIDRLGLARPS